MRNDHAWLFAMFGFMVLAPARGQYAKCTEIEVSQARVERICDRSLPWTSVVWMPNAQGEPCYCECARLGQTTLNEIASMRDERIVQIKATSAQFAHDLPPNVSKRTGIRILLGNGGPLHITRVSVSNGTVLDMEVLNEAALCPDLVLFLSVLRAVNNAGFTAEFSVLIGARDTGFQFPEIESVGTGSYVIRVPNIFLANAEVGYELMAFMILHELGHAYTNGNECAADEWAADVGMRGLFPGPGLIHALQQVPIQYLNYERSLRGLPDFVPGSSGEYADFVCRSDAIRNIHECLAEGVGRHGYPGDCFRTTYIEGDPDYRTELCPENRVCDEVFEPILLDHISTLLVFDEWLKRVHGASLRSRMPKNLLPVAHRLAKAEHAIKDQDKERLKRMLAAQVRRLNRRTESYLKQ